MLRPFRYLVLAGLMLPAAAAAQGTFPAPSELNERPPDSNQPKSRDDSPPVATFRMTIVDEAEGNTASTPLFEEFNARKKRIDESQERSKVTLRESRAILNTFPKPTKPAEKKQYDSLVAKVNRLEAELLNRGKIIDSTQATVKTLKEINAGLSKYSRATFKSSYTSTTGQHGEFLSKIKLKQERLKLYEDSLKELKKAPFRSKSDEDRWKRSDDSVKRASKLLDELRKSCSLLENEVIEGLLDGIGNRESHLSPTTLNSLLSRADSISNRIGNHFSSLDAQFTFLDEERRGTNALNPDDGTVEALDAQPSLLFSSAFVTPTINLLGRFDDRRAGRRVYGYLFKGPEGVDSTDASYNLTRLFLPAASTFGFTVGYSEVFGLLADRNENEHRYNVGLGFEANLVWKRFSDFTSTVQTMLGTNGAAKKITSAPLTNIAFLHLKPTVSYDVVKNRLNIYGMANLIFPLDKVEQYQAAFKRFNNSFAEKKFVLFNLGARAYFPLNEAKDKLLSFDINLMFHNAQTRALLPTSDGGTLSDTGIPILQIGYKSVITKK